MLLVPSLVTAFSFASSVSAWGGLGHKTVANIAQTYLTEATLNSVSAILAADGHRKTPNPTLVDVATWADDFAHKKGGTFSKGFHYIDAKDDPPFACNVDLDRDCSKPGGCVVKAIANYTQQLVNPGRNVNDTADALKFIIHFIGDITQPLHTEDKQKGGNGIPVVWDGNERKNLHGVWDTDMITKFAGRDTEQSLDAWTADIVKEIDNGIYTDQISDWIRCTDVNDALNCALDWATDTNFFVCDYVLKTDPEGKELDGTYYRGATPIIQQQIAKGGIRLAVWLNQLFGSGEAGQLEKKWRPLVVQERA